MLDQILAFFEIIPDVDLNIMKQGQDLFDITSETLLGLKKVINDLKPDIVLVQGDTTTAFAASLAAFYNKIKVAHIEAGLRTHQMYSPFPEEINRKMISQVAFWHFAPTQRAKENLISEGITENVFVTGNTVVDALLWGKEIIQGQDQTKFLRHFKSIDFSKKIVLVTGHRRENFEEPLNEICKSLKKIADTYPDIELVYPVHLNPLVQKPVYELLSHIENIHLIAPLPYPELIWILSKCYLVLTDSGGIQEEAPTFGKPVIVMREFTEREEGIKTGSAILAGIKYRTIVSAVSKILNSNRIYYEMVKAGNPYGDGRASERIINRILDKM
jgi:UDP-N-acetylglucosamine 2-epimerase (non-hydrolysing)